MDSFDQRRFEIRGLGQFVLAHECQAHHCPGDTDLIMRGSSDQAHTSSSPRSSPDPAHRASRYNASAAASLPPLPLYTLDYLRRRRGRDWRTP